MNNSTIPKTMKDQKSFEVIMQDCSPEKKDVVDKLLQRSEARIAEIERKKTAKETRTSAYEQTDYFNVTFSLQKQQIETKLQKARKFEGNSLLAYLDDIVRDLQELQKFLSDSTLFLPTYDIKKGQETLKTLQEDIHVLIPKKKFAFKTKIKPTNGLPIAFDPPYEGQEMLEAVENIHSIIPKRKLAFETEVETKVAAEPKNDATEESFSAVKLCKCGFKDFMDRTLVKFREEIDKQDVGLHQLRNCTVYLYGAPSTIFMNGLVDCIILSGPVSTSVFVENCVRCTFVLACQQLRVHTCLDSYFYLHVTSRTIIEDSKELYIAPYNWSYENQDKDFAVSGLDKSNNNWKSIDDFNWLVISTPSPNWSFLDESKHKSWS